MDLERNVLELDSRYRNFRNVLNQESVRLAGQVDPTTAAHGTLRDDLLALLEEEDAQLTATEALVSELARLEEVRAIDNLEHLRAAQELDSLTRAYEHAKLVVLSSQFPSHAQSALFIWNQVLADSLCLLCGNDADELKRAIEDRIASDKCTVCTNALASAADPDGQSASEPVELARERSVRTWDDLSAQRALVKNLEQEVAAATAELRAAETAMAEDDLRRTVRAQRISTLRQQLPPDPQGYLTDRSHVAAMTSRLSAMAEELREAATTFDRFVDEMSRSILLSAENIKERFDLYAHLFLLGEGELSWSPREEQIGQSAYRVKFPAYELQLGRNDGIISTRSGAADVSESQKEFIDLAFRMALIDTAGQRGGASILIDTPESSLDAVFSNRAAIVLADFLSDSNNHLVVASNLTDGRLVPALISQVKENGGSWSILNLLKVARPTPAIVELGQEYENAYNKLMVEVDRG